MAVTYQQASQYVGQRVVAHGIDGRRHYGVLQSVTSTGIHIRPMRWGTLMVGFSSRHNESRM
jgi:hypothetical protein